MSLANAPPHPQVGRQAVISGNVVLIIVLLWFGVVVAHIHILYVSLTCGVVSNIV